MSILRVMYLFYFSLLPLNATIYEDAEDKTISHWEVVSSSSKSRIENIYDKLKQSRVIRFNGEGLKSTYKLNLIEKKSLKESDSVECWLSWDMNYKEDFVVIVVVQTTRGESHIIYTSGEGSSYRQFGLGGAIVDGKWHTVRRNIQDDLDYFDNREKLLYIKTFVIKGNGSIDNIRTDSKIVKKQKSKKKIKASVKTDNTNSKNNTLPVIKMAGDNPTYLVLGEEYVEEGVMAYDKEDGKIEVEIIDDIDSSEEGTYMVMYMARDSKGDVSLDRRVVIVGDGSVKKVKRQEEIQNKDIIKQEDIKDNNYSKKYMIRLWEKENFKREKEK